MNKHRDSNIPKLNVLLCETLVAVYVSWLCYALALYDANMLYRLVGHSFHESIWALLFGGCCKKQVVVSTPNPSEQQGTLISETALHADIFRVPHLLIIRNLFLT